MHALKWSRPGSVFNCIWPLEKLCIETVIEAHWKWKSEPWYTVATQPTLKYL